MNMPKASPLPARRWVQLGLGPSRQMSENSYGRHGVNTPSRTSCDRISMCIYTLYIYVYVYIHIIYMVIYTYRYTYTTASDSSTHQKLRPWLYGFRLSCFPKVAPGIGLVACGGTRRLQRLSEALELGTKLWAVAYMAPFSQSRSTRACLNNPGL